jgi:hypothetical protein
MNFGYIGLDQTGSMIHWVKMRGELRVLSSIIFLGKMVYDPAKFLYEMFQEVAAARAALPGAVISVLSYGDSLNLYPHIHAIAGR